VTLSKFRSYLGSNIGSTITAQIVAFKVTDYALALVAAGALMALFSKKDSTKNIGFVILVLDYSFMV